jgi:hypothetical protein
MTGTELLEMKKAAGNISDGPLGSKLLAFTNAPSAPVIADLH